MKSLIIILCLLLYSSAGFTQKLKVERRVTDHSVYLKGNGFEGVIFDNLSSLIDTVKTNKYRRRSYLLSVAPLLFNIDTAEYKKYYAPSGKEIAVAEQLLKNYISKLNSSQDNDFIKRNLKKYLRQYLGYINKNGDKVVFLKCLWKGSTTDMEKQESSTKMKKWTDDVIFIEDGGCYYWQIKININSGELFDYRVNGTA